MKTSSWLPKAYDLSNGQRIHSLLFSGNEWQIFSTDAAAYIVVAVHKLAEKWISSGFLDKSLFADIVFGAERYMYFCSRNEYTLEPVEEGRAPEDKLDALAFALAFRESRMIGAEASFHDSIYVEQYSRLLPVWSLTPYVEDAIVLGTWISGGVVVSTDAFRRLSNLTGWMSSSDLAEIVTAAGFNVPADSGMLTKQRPANKKPEHKTQPKESLAEPRHAHSAERESAPKFFSLPGRPNLETFFNEHVIDIIFNPGKYEALGIDFPAAMVLHGPPGCGKTYAVERLVEFIDWPCYSIDSNSVGSPYIHETSKKISEMFSKAIDAAPSVFVIDEMESYLSDRSAAGSGGHHRVEEVAEFLRRIPEAIQNKVLIIAMTNMIDLVDPAILRRGRFDHIIEVGMPSRHEVAALVENLLLRIPCSQDLSLENVLDFLTGKPLSDAAFMIREAARLAAKAGKTQIDQESINEALQRIPSSKQDKTRKIGFVHDP